jgi:hypothetical protein
MKHGMRWAAMVLTAGLLAASTAAAQMQIGNANIPLGGAAPGGGQGGAGMAAGNQGYTGSTMPVGSETSIVLRAITNLNIEPDFTLSVDQKTKIKAATDALDKSIADWRAAHKDELDKGELEWNAAMMGADSNRIAAAQKVMDTLYKSMPQTGDLDKKLVAILTDAQKKAVAKEVDKLTPVGGMGVMGGGMGGGGGGMGMQPNGGKN